MSLFVKPEMGPPLLAQQFKLGAKRPFSPSSFISPSKRKLLAVEGILSPKSTPFRRVVRDLKNALPSPAPLRLPLLKSPVKHLVPQGSPRSPVTPSTPPPLNSKKRKFGLDDSPNELLSPSPSVGKDTRPLRKPRTPTIHTSQEAQLLAMLNAAPLPSEKPATPDEEDEHYPGFDVYVDEEEESSETPHFTSDIIDDEEDKENKAPVKEVSHGAMCPAA